MRHLLFFLLLIGFFGLSFGWQGCARIVPPTGGPKDTLAPRLVNAIPAQGSTDFHGKTITLDFDENIAVNALNQQLIISPVQDNIYTYKLRGKRLELTFEKPFPQLATVFLNFRSAITDINEKTIAKDIRLAFATGPVLDTLHVGGIVTELMTSKPVKNALVGLWPDLDTTDIRKQRPQYLAVTDEKGIYHLENIRPNRYQLAAFADNNGNARWSGKREQMGFYPEPIDIATDTAFPLVLTTIDEEKPRLERTQAAPKAQAEVRFAEGIIKFDAFADGDSLPRQPTDGTLATFRVYFPQAWQDTLALRIHAVDSSGNVRDSTVRIGPYKAPRGARPDTGKPFTLRMQVEGNIGRGGYFLPAPAALTLPEPMAFTALPPRLLFRKDTQPETKPLATAFNIYRNRLAFSLPYSTAKSYTVFTPDGLVTAGRSPLKADTLPFTITTEEEVGLIRGKIGHQAAHTILELLSEQGVVLKTLYDAKTFELLGLYPGNYILRLTLDVNGNRRLDLPRYSTRTPGEVVLPPTEPIKVKANWEVELGPIFTEIP